MILLKIGKLLTRKMIRTCLKDKKKNATFFFIQDEKKTIKSYQKRKKEIVNGLLLNWNGP